MSVNADASIRQVRRAAGISQEALAQCAGCSLSMVRLLESGYRPDASNVLDRVLSVLAQKAETEPGDRHDAG
jgi:transcriptional regulator with XRE-family HTH domain